jgi:sec-independent protein translocase protein TatA
MSLTVEDSLMDGMSIWHWIIVIIVVLLLFGRGKVSGLMADVAEGIKAFRKSMSEDEKPADPRSTKSAETND